MKRNADRKEAHRLADLTGISWRLYYRVLRHVRRSTATTRRLNGELAARAAHPSHAPGPDRPAPSAPSAQDIPRVMLGMGR